MYICISYLLYMIYQIYTMFYKLSEIRKVFSRLDIKSHIPRVIDHKMTAKSCKNHAFFVMSLHGLFIILWQKIDDNSPEIACIILRKILISLILLKRKPTSTSNTFCRCLSTFWGAWARTATLWRRVLTGFVGALGMSCPASLNPGITKQLEVGHLSHQLLQWGSQDGLAPSLNRPPTKCIKMCDMLE